MCLCGQCRDSGLVEISEDKCSFLSWRSHRAPIVMAVSKWVVFWVTCRRPVHLHPHPANIQRVEEMAHRWNTWYRDCTGEAFKP